MPHIRDSRMVGRLGVASPMISPLSLRYREEKEKVEIMVWFPFLEPLTLCTVINYVKIIKNKNNRLKLKKKKESSHHPLLLSRISRELEWMGSSQHRNQCSCNTRVHCLTTPALMVTSALPNTTNKFICNIFPAQTILYGSNSKFHGKSS